MSVMASRMLLYGTDLLAKFLLIPIPLGRVGLVLAAVVLVVWLVRRQRR